MSETYTEMKDRLKNQEDRRNEWLHATVAVPAQLNRLALRITKAFDDLDAADRASSSKLAAVRLDTLCDTAAEVLGLGRTGTDIYASLFNAWAAPASGQDLFERAKPLAKVLWGRLR